MRTFFRFLIHQTRAFCLLLSLLLCLVGCNATATWEEEDEGDLPVIGSVDEAPSGKRVAITFDDGPHNVYTKSIVDALTEYEYHATFFVVGNRVDGTAYNGADALRYAAEAGNEIAIHGYTHEQYYNKCDDAVYEAELSKTKDAILEAYPDVSIKLMRPVGGAITADRIDECPYSVILWDVDSEDWRHKSPSSSSDPEEAAQKVEVIVENVMDSVQDGSIILLHDIYENTRDATLIILRQLHEQGYEVVTVSELLGERMVAGEKYSSYDDAK